MDKKDKDKNEKPNLKVVKFPEIETLNPEQDLSSALVSLYYTSREAFSYIEDVDLQLQAIDHLRKAFLLALNPLSEIDKNFDVYIIEE